MNMIDEKDPGQESVNSDSSDDEVIIDLTEEITDKSEDEIGKLELSEDLTDHAQQDFEIDEASEFDDDEDILALDETDEMDLPEDQVIDDADNQAAEDHLLASAINASLGAEDEETEEMAEEISHNASDAGEIAIVDNPPDEAHETISAMADNHLAEAQRDEDVFDLEEEVELEYEWDDDEDELIDLDDERIEDNQDFVELMLGVSNKSDQRDDDDDEATEYLDLETEDKDDVVVLDTDRDQDTDIIALAGEETPDFADSDDLPVLGSTSDFDFEDEEDGLALAESETDSSDGIAARAVEQSLGSDGNRDQIDLVDQDEFGMEDNDAIIELDDSQEDDEEFLAMEAEEPLMLEDNEDLLDLNGRADLETDDEIIPLDRFNDLDTEDGEQIIEITEFDQHFQADGEGLLEQSGILDASGADEEDFLELIDIEEDRLSDDEKIAEFSNSPEAASIDKINQFFSDELEDDQTESLAPEFLSSDDLDDVSLENQVTESNFDDSAKMKSGLDDEVLAVAEEAPGVNPEPAAEADIPILNNEKFDSDHRSIAQQVDRLDRFLSEDAADQTQVAPLPVDQAAKEEAGLDNSQIIQGLEGLQSMPAGQIDAAIERIISEKFSDKIEGIIYKVIEKAVSKEIDRLKRALTGTNTIDDNED